MNKICTTIEQSKKLVELGLDVNTADICWTNHLFSALLSSWRIESTPPQEYKNLLDGFVVRGYLIEPAWSLGALMGLIPDKISINDESYYLYFTKKRVEFRGPITWDGQKTKSFEMDNILDAAFEMVVWLKENGKI